LPSFIPGNIGTDYQLLLDVREVPDIAQRGMILQNQSNSVVWLKLEIDTRTQEFAFLATTVIAMDLPRIQFRVWIKASAPIEQNEGGIVPLLGPDLGTYVCATFW
jgi:hypothetical protein